MQYTILDDMATSEERVKGLETQNTNIRERLGTIEGSLATLSVSKQPHWAVSVLVAAVLAWMGWLSVQVIGQGNKLTGVMMILTPQATLKNLTSAVSAQPAQAKKDLEQVADSIHKLSKAKVNLPEQTVDETSEELSKLSDTHKDLPETWQAIGAFITYRSQMIRGWEDTNLPPCDNQFHRALASTTKGSNVITHGPVEVHDCKIILDSPETSKNLSIDLSIANVAFTHCAVFYNGGPIILVPVKMATDTPAQLIGRLSFKECLFVVSLSGVPAAHGVEFARALLSAPSGTLELAPPA